MNENMVFLENTYLKTKTFLKNQEYLCLKIELSKARKGGIGHDCCVENGKSTVEKEGQRLPHGV